MVTTVRERVAARFRFYLDETSRYAMNVNAYEDNGDPNVTVLRDVLDEASAILGSLQVDEHGAVPVEQADEVSALAVLLGYGRRVVPQVRAWCVVSEYDPAGGFRPGRSVVWEARHTEDEAQAALPLWVEHLNRPRDRFFVELRPTSLSTLRLPGATIGPSA